MSPEWRPWSEVMLQLLNEANTLKMQELTAELLKMSEQDASTEAETEW
jgi:hypothetical protein